MVTDEHDGPLGARRLSVLVASMLLLGALTGGLAWASADVGQTNGPQHASSPAFALGLARLRKLESPGGGAWAPLRLGDTKPFDAHTTVGVWPDEAGVRVPNDFLGLSFEATTLTGLPALARARTLEHLLRSLGRGTLRFGGGTVNRYVAWTQPGTPRPPWATQTVSRRDFEALAAITDRTGWKALLTTNLAHYEAPAAGEEAAAANQELGPSLYGIAVANEPDRFRHFGLRARSWGFSGYARELAGYRAAIAASAPGARIAAPDASTGEPPLPWVWESLGLHPSILTDHYYPLTSCGHKPTVSELLGPIVRLKESVMLKTLSDIQRTAGTPMQLDETNNVSCKGQPGVSNSFASALWAADFIARAMRAGLRGVDFHDLPSRPRSYSPIVGEGASLHANPEWYGLLLTRGLQGTRVLPTDVSTRSELTAQAFLRPDGGLEVLLVDFDAAGTAPDRVTLKIHGRAGEGTITRLTAPSASATSDVRLGGAEVATSGSWHPKPPLAVVHHRGDSLGLTMPASSAALVAIAPEPAPEEHQRRR
jgi:hypothetical protein